MEACCSLCDTSVQPATYIAAPSPVASIVLKRARFSNQSLYRPPQPNLLVYVLCACSCLLCWKCFKSRLPWALVRECCKPWHNIRRTHGMPKTLLCSLDPALDTEEQASHIQTHSFPECYTQDAALQCACCWALFCLSVRKPTLQQLGSLSMICLVRVV